METHRPNKRRSDATTEEAEDRLSALPDDLLHCILREVPLKYAVRTSALSRRWPRLWLRALAASPVLDFSDRDFARRQPAAQAVATVRRCLRLHVKRGAPLDAFRVAFRSPAGGFRCDVLGWVAAALARGAREVAVDLAPTCDDLGQQDVDGSVFLELPADLFAATNSLARLALVRCSLRAVPPGAPGLAGLRSLSLSHADIFGEALRDFLLATCRSLEFLSLRSCNDLLHVRVAGEKLRGLELVRCLGVLDVEVTAPALESFVFHGDITHFGADSLVVNFGPTPSDEDDGTNFITSVRASPLATPALLDAYLSHLGFEYPDRKYYEDHCFAYYSLLTSVAHATTLTMCSVGLQHIDTAQAAAAKMDVAELEWQLQPLRNAQMDETQEFWMDMPTLQELQLLMPSLCDDDVDRIAGFFEFIRPPVLDRLFIRLSGGGKASRASGGGAGTVLAGKDGDNGYIASTSDIVLGHLKFIKVVSFRGTRCEMRLLRFLVGRAPALEQLVLVAAGDLGDEQMKVVQGRVTAMRMASPVPRVVVCRPREDGSRNPAHTRYYHEELC